MVEDRGKKSTILAVHPLHWYKCQCLNAWMLMTNSTRNGEDVWIPIGCFSQFLVQVWVCSMSLHLHSMTSYYWAQTVSTERSHRPSATSSSGQELRETNYYRWSDVGLWVWCQNKASVVTVKVKVTPNSEKRELIECEDCTQCLGQYEFIPRGQAVNQEFSWSLYDSCEN